MISSRRLVDGTVTDRVTTIEANARRAGTFFGLAAISPTPACLPQTSRLGMQLVIIRGRNLVGERYKVPRVRPPIER